MAEKLKSACDYGAIQKERTAVTKRNLVSANQSRSVTTKSKQNELYVKSRKVSVGCIKSPQLNKDNTVNSDLDPCRQPGASVTRPTPVRMIAHSTKVKQRSIDNRPKLAVRYDSNFQRVEKRRDSVQTDMYNDHGVDGYDDDDTDDDDDAEEDSSGDEEQEFGEEEQECKDEDDYHNDGDELEADDDITEDSRATNEVHCRHLSKDDKENDHVLLGANVSTTVVTGASTSSLEDGFHEHCRLLGTMDSSASFAKEIEKVTKRWGWKMFKMLTKEDYNYDSDFAECMLHYINLSTAEEQKNPKIQERDWRRVKAHVIEAMQHARSACTQSLKFKFIGKMVGSRFVA
jgi:hypothetical protein